MKTLTKYDSESVLYDFNMGGLGRLGAGDTIAGINSIYFTPAGPTVVTQAHDGQHTVQARISGGTAGKSYRIDVKVDTTSGDTLEGRAYLKVE